MAAWQPELVPSTTTILPGAKDLRPEMLAVRSSQPRRKSRRGQVVGGEDSRAGGLIQCRHCTIRISILCT